MLIIPGVTWLFSLSVGAKRSLLPMNPESVTVATGSSMNTFEVLDPGRSIAASRDAVDRIMWDGIPPRGITKKCVICEEMARSEEHRERYRNLEK